MQLAVSFSWSAAHRLPRCTGCCSRLRGHDRRLEGMVEDTSDEPMPLEFTAVSAGVDLSYTATCAPGGEHPGLDLEQQG